MWQCKKCREQVEAAFEVCWNCGTSKDGVEDESFTRADDAAPTDAGTPVEPTPIAPPRPERHQPVGDCPKCGARKVIPGVRILDQDGQYADKSLLLRLDRNPGSWLFPGAQLAQVRAHVCGACGYVELYAVHPGALWAAYQEQEEGR